MRTIRPGEPLPWNVAHRGCSAVCPENTLAAFRQALRTEVDGIELDVQASRDGVPFVYHDRTLRKVGGGARRVSSLDAGELRRLDAGAWFDPRFRGERIPTLDEALDQCGGKTHLLIEIKARANAGQTPEQLDELAQSTVRAIVGRKLVSSALVLCFDERVLGTVRSLPARVRTVLNLAQLPRLDAPAWRRLDPLFALSVDVRALTKRFVDDAHERGKPVFVYTCNTPRTARAALDAGADALMSDRPEWLRELLPAGAPLR